MKKLIGTIIIVGMLVTNAACSGHRDVSTSYGVVENVECVGFGKDQDPRFKYEIDTRNAVWTIVGGTAALPIVCWALEYVYCPIGEATPSLM